MLGALLKRYLLMFMGIIIRERFRMFLRKAAKKLGRSGRI